MSKLAMFVGISVAVFAAQASATETACIDMKMRAVKTAVSSDLRCSTMGETDENFDVDGCMAQTAARLAAAFRAADNYNPPDGCTESYDADSCASDIESFTSNVADFMYFDYQLR
jgi:hypothetical protein